MVLPLKLIEDAVDVAHRDDARVRLGRAGWKRWSLYDRGSYEWIDAPDVGALSETLVALARRASGRAVVLQDMRAVRMLPGDYVFVRHDRVHDDEPLEVVVDLSIAPVPGAEVHYRHRGQVFFVFPSRPGAVGLVQRGPTVMRNSTYVSRRWTNAEVVRIFALLR